MIVKLNKYEAKIITRKNHEEVWAVYESNPDYFMLHKGRVAMPDDVLDTFNRLVDGYPPSKQYFVGFWQDSMPCAVLELLPDFPNAGELWLSEIIVHGDMQKIGLGKKIVQAVIEASIGYNSINLGTDPHLVTFWEGLGFVQTGESGGFVGFSRAYLSSKSTKVD